MKIKSLLTETRREIWRTRNRFLSIVAIVALGTGFFTGIKATTPNMKQTADDYYSLLNLSDFHLLSTYGVTKDDLVALRQIKGVVEVMPGYSADVFMKLNNDTEAIVKLISLPPNNSGLNQLVLEAGRMPATSSECLFDSGSKQKFLLGDTIPLLATKQDKPLSDMISITSCEIVGFASSARYIDFERGSTSVGNGVVTAFIMLPEQAFLYEEYTDVYLALEQSKKLSSFSSDYETLSAEYQTKLEALAKQRGQLRYADIMKEANTKLMDAKQELADGKNKANKKLQDAWQKIDSAEQDLLEGKQKLLDEVGDAQAKIDQAKIDLIEGEATYQKEYQDYLLKIKEGQQEIDDGWIEIEKGEAKLEKGRRELASAKREFEAKQAVAIFQLQTAQQHLDQLTTSYFHPLAGWIATMDTINPTLPLSESDTAILSTFIQGANQATLNELETMLRTFQSYHSAELQQGILGYVSVYQSAAQDQINKGYAELQQGSDMIRDAERDLSVGQRELNQARLDLEKGQRTLLEEQVKAEIEFKDARLKLEDGNKKISEAILTLEQETNKAMREIEDGEKKIKDGKYSYAKGKKEAQQEIRNGEVKIEDAEKEIAKLEKPQWYVFDRTNQPGYAGYEEDAVIVDKVAAVFPIFFILIAALVCFSTMTRMVEEQRTQIGTLKALGYSKIAIVSKYLIYASLASVLGCIIGLAIGLPFFPVIIFNAYRIMYQLPDIVTPLHWDLAIGSMIVAILCTTLAAYAACFHELGTQPSQLMRPKAPKDGKRVLLERIPWLWNRISFHYKITIRNMLRYKGRVFLTMLGIGGCTALMLTGFGLQYSISSIVEKQFDTIFHYDILGATEEHLTSTEVADLSAALDRSTYLTDHMYIYQKKIDVSVEDNVRSIYLFVPSQPDQVEKFIQFQTRIKKTALQLNDSGVIITEKLAKLLKLKVGDTMMVEEGKQKKEVLVNSITENYTMNYVYMTPSYYQQIFNNKAENNLFIANMVDDSSEHKSLLSVELLEQGTILGVSYSTDSGKNFADMIGSLGMIVLVLIVSAGALAFVVLYTLTNINVNERLRELATIKVLGFYDMEVSSYIYRENTISAVLGMFAGIFMGIFLHQFVIQTAEVEMVMFTPSINLPSYIYSCILTLAFTFIVNFALHYRLKKIDMVESLKSVE